jgi:flagellar motor switch protein FliM
MADQILSQEEIDALLGAMANGEVDLDAEEEKKNEVTPWDLTSKSVQLEDEFSALDEVFDKFSSIFRKSLSALLQREVMVEFDTKEVKSFDKLINGCATPTLFDALSMEPLLNTALVVIEPGLVFSFIDCMFGGTGKPFGKTREFTLIELSMARKVNAELNRALEKAWEVVSPAVVESKKLETKPEFVHLFGPSEMVLVASFSVKGEEFEGVIAFCVSYLMLEPIKDKLSTSYIREKDIELKWSREIRELIRDAELDVVAELGSTTRKVRDILNFKKGDIIRLSAGPQDFVTLTVNSVPKFRGFPGIIKGSRAVEIAEKIDSHRGQKADARF